MKRVFTLLITCFLFFKSYALSDNRRVLSGAPYAKIRIIYRELIAEPPEDKIDSVRLCRGDSTTLIPSGQVDSNASIQYTWYLDGVVLEKKTSTLTVSVVGKYEAKLVGSLKYTAIVTLYEKPGKPTITFID